MSVSLIIKLVTFVIANISLFTQIRKFLFVLHYIILLTAELHIDGGKD